MSRLLLLNKPFQTLCQFTDDQGRSTLADYIDTKRYPNFYAAGRLDYDSEGLVALTDDGQLQHQLANPKFKLAKTYWVQVEGNPDKSACEMLAKGVTLNDGPTRPCKARIIEEPDLWPRNPPIRFRQNSPTHWLEISISEGRNRQVRRMTAAVGLPTLRLVRAAIGQWQVEGLAPGDSKLIEVHLPATKPQPKPRKRNR